MINQEHPDASPDSHAYYDRLAADYDAKRFCGGTGGFNARTDLATDRSPKVIRVASDAAILGAHA